MTTGRPRVYSSEAAKAEAERIRRFLRRQELKNEKKSKEPTKGNPTINFNNNTLPHNPSEPQTPESSAKAVGITQKSSPRFEHLMKGPVRKDRTGRLPKYKSREEALAAKKESDDRRYLREREQRRLKKQLQRQLKKQLTQSAQVVPKAERQQITTTNESQDI
jgi:hypothetical protein